MMHAHCCGLAVSPSGTKGEANADQKITGVDQTQYYAAMYARKAVQKMVDGGQLDQVWLAPRTYAP